MNWRRVRILAVKEVKELSKERVVLFGMLLGPIIIFGIMGLAMASVTKQVQESVTVFPSIVLVWEGEGPVPGVIAEIADILSNVTTVIVTAGEPPKGYTAVVYVDEGFVDNITRGVPGRVLIVYNATRLSFLTLQEASRIETAIAEAVQELVARQIRGVYPEATGQFLQSPVTGEYLVWYRGEAYDPEQLSILIGGVSLGIPMATIILAFAAMHVSAISIAGEKESRTLESLLTLPLSRRELILGKALGVTALVVLGVISYGVGLYIYIRMMLAPIEAQGQAGGAPGFNLELGATPAIIIVVALGLSMVVASLIGFALGALVGDLRSAQMATSYAGLILLIPVFIAMFGADPAGISPGARIVLALDPFMLLVYASVYSLIGETKLAIYSLAGLAAHIVAWTLVAARLVSSEYLVTGSSRLQRLLRRSRPTLEG